MRRPDEGWDAMPIARDGERALPDARRPVAGALKGNRNAFKHGRYSADALARRREVATLIRTMRTLAEATKEPS